MNTQQGEPSLECDVCGDSAVRPRDESQRIMRLFGSERRCRVCSQLARAYVLATLALAKN